MDCNDPLLRYHLDLFSTWWRIGQIGRFVAAAVLLPKDANRAEIVFIGSNVVRPVVALRSSAYAAARLRAHRQQPKLCRDFHCTCRGRCDRGRGNCFRAGGRRPSSLKTTCPFVLLKPIYG